jgi:hypothetical protein
VHANIFLYCVREIRVVGGRNQRRKSEHGDEDICSMSLTTSIMWRQERNHCARVERAQIAGPRDGRGPSCSYVVCLMHAANAAATAGDYDENRSLDLEPPLLG